MEKSLFLSKAILISLIMVLSTTLVPGCLDGSSDEETGVNATAPATPKEAMGLWLPVVDGYIGYKMVTLAGEWSDSYEQDIEFSDDKGNAKSAKLMVKSVDHSMSLALTSVDFDVSPANIIVHLNERTLVSQVEGNPALSYSSMDCEKMDCGLLTSELDKSTPSPTHMIPISPLNSIATTYTFSSNELITEATAMDLFVNSTQVDLRIEIKVDGEGWFYEESFNFEWVFPLIYPLTDVSIEGIEVTQAIQTENNDVRLVEGKDTLVRVYIDSGFYTTLDVKVTLMYCILIFCTKSIEKIHTAVQNPQRENYLDSANFQLPADWVTHPGLEGPLPIGLFAKIEHISPDGEIAYLDTNPDNDDMFHVAWFNVTHDLNIYYIPLTVNGSISSSSQIDDVFSTMNSIFPSDINLVEVSTMLFPNASDYDSGDFKVQGAELLLYIMIFSGFSGLVPFPDQFVLLHPANERLTSEFSGNSLCGSSTPEWGSGGDLAISSFVTISKTSDECIQKLTPSHEINHNLGPLGDTENWGGHIGPECNADNDDTDWFALHGSDRTIEDLGWTSWFENTETNNSSLIDPDMRELQGYCRSIDSFGNPSLNPFFTKWISFYRWDHLYDLFSDWEVGNPTGRSSEDTSRVVSLSVGDNASGEIHYTYTLENSALKPVQSDDRNSGERYELRTFSSDSRLIESAKIVKQPHHVHSKHDGLEGENQSMLIVLSETEPVDEIHLVHISETGIESLIDAFYNNSEELVISVDELPNRFESRDQEVTISWSIGTTTNRPNVLYQLEYSWGNDIWLPVDIPTERTSVTMEFGKLPGSNEAAFRIKAMNGMATSYGTSNSFSLPFQNPTSELTFSENLHDGKLNYGEAFDFEIKFTDPDWAAPNLDSFKARLVNEQGNVVWGEGAQVTNRLITNLIHSGGSSSTGSAGIAGQEKGDNWQGDVHGQTHNAGIIGHNEVGISFPNNQILNAELLPGNYKLEVEYTDEHGGMVTEKFEFLIEVGPTQTVEYRERLLENYRKDLLQPGDNVPDMGMNELQYVITLQMVNSGDLTMKNLTPAQLGDLMQIPESRRDDLIKLGESDNMDRLDND